MQLHMNTLDLFRAHSSTHGLILLHCISSLMLSMFSTIALMSSSRLSFVDSCKRNGIGPTPELGHRCSYASLCVTGWFELRLEAPLHPASSRGNPISDGRRPPLRPPATFQEPRVIEGGIEGDIGRGITSPNPLDVLSGLT